MPKKRHSQQQSVITSEEQAAEFSVSRRNLLRGGATAGAAASMLGLLGACGSSGSSKSPGGTVAALDPAKVAADDPLRGSSATNMQGKKVAMGFAVLAGWPPSALPIDLFPDFAQYAKTKYGYDVTVSKTEAPFAELFQKIAPSLAAKSQDFNLMISDSQWLGALSEPGWIVRAEDVYTLNPELDLPVYSSLVRNTYQVYPDGSGQRWGFPQMPDTQGIFMRLDMLQDPAEQAAFQAKYGRKLPTTYEEFDPLTINEYEDIFAFFTRPDKGLYGTAMMYGKDYDSFSCAYHPYAYVTGDIWNPQTGEVIGFLNTAEHAKALEYFVSLQKYQPPGPESFGIGTMIDLFNNGQVFSALQWLAVGLFMQGTDGALKGKVLACPHPKFKQPDGSTSVIGAMGGQPWVINSFNDAEHMRVSIDFLKWWYSDETQQKFIAKGGLPWTKAGVDAPGFEESSVYARAFKSMLGEGKSRDFWHLPEYAELLAIQQEAYNAYAAGQVSDPKRVLDYIAVKQQEILLKSGRTTVAIPADIKNITLQ
jgi:multiple sugar transport system substrate-binding protein